MLPLIGGDAFGVPTPAGSVTNLSLAALKRGGIDGT
jgi:hypothetical protein